MPADTLTAPPPSVTQAPAPGAVTADVAAARAAKVTINASAIAPTATPASAPKPGTAREELSKRLEARARPETFGQTAPAAAAATPKTPDPNAPTGEAEAAATGEEGEAAATGDKGEATAPKPGETVDPKKGKANPWRLVDDYKSRLSAAEQRIAEMSKTAMAPEAVKTLNERLTKAEARAQELEQEIKFTDYSKSAEFKKEYQEPYEKAWTSAMNELRELTVESPDGSQRPISANDMLALVNLTLPEARKLAVETFGEFADDVMAHRKEIKKLFEAQSTALTEARKMGDERTKQTSAQRELAQTELKNFVTETWTKANEEATKHPKHGVHFKPIEGDEVGNAKLAKGFELVDRAFAENPADPRLTPEQRADIIQRHAAVRNRAAAYSRLVHQIDQRQQRIAELEKKLAGYEASSPGITGSEAAPNGQPSGSTRDGVFARLRQKAH